MLADPTGQVLRVVGPADAAEVGHPARQRHVPRVAADVDQRGLREDERQQAEIKVIVRHLVHDPVRGKPSSAVEDLVQAVR